MSLGRTFKGFLHTDRGVLRIRYLKIAQTMAVIDKICQEMTATFCDLEGFEGLVFSGRLCQNRKNRARQ